MTEAYLNATEAVLVYPAEPAPFYGWYRFSTSEPWTRVPGVYPDEASALKAALEVSKDADPLDLLSPLPLSQAEAEAAFESYQCDYAEQSGGDNNW